MTCLSLREVYLSEDRAFVFKVPVESLVRTEGQFSEYENSPKVKEIVKDIKSGKKLRPLTVMPTTKMDQEDYKDRINQNSKWTVINGHHRLTAYEILGIKNIPVRIEVWDKRMEKRAESFLQQQNINYKAISYDSKKEMGLDQQIFWRIRGTKERVAENAINEAYYHGTTVELRPGDLVLPPSETGKISEKGRKKHLDKVFFTQDLNSAKIYAGRTRYTFGGEPKLYEVEPIGKIEPIQMKPGTTVMMAPRAKVIRIIPLT